jgi:hypothetical protein
MTVHEVRHFGVLQMSQRRNVSSLPERSCCQHYSHISSHLQAEALRSKAQRPEVSRSATQTARYLYYHGRILAVQLDYTAARDTLQQAARKVPPLRCHQLLWFLSTQALSTEGHQGSHSPKRAGQQPLYQLQSAACKRQPFPSAHTDCACTCLHSE